eukprot:m.274107 g.274107  ORF g.274107 m.274107 type:complete len:349 (-) comp26895_c1_seq1:80-1126(-)
MWCNTSSRPNHHAPVPSERCLRMHIIRMLGLHSVAEFGTAGLDVIDPGCKGHVGRNRQAEPTRLDDCALAPKDLHAVSGLTGRLWVRLAVGPRLPQRGPDITWRDNVDAHSVFCFINGEPFGEGGDGALCGSVGRGLRLTMPSHPRSHVDNVALGLPDMRERKLARRKVGDKVELEQVLHLFDGKIIDGFWWGVPPRVVDETIDPAKLAHRLGDEVLQVLDFRDVALHKHDPLAPFGVCHELGHNLVSLCLCPGTDDKVCAGLEEDPGAPFANPLGAARDDDALAHVPSLTAHHVGGVLDHAVRWWRRGQNGSFPGLLAIGVSQDDPGLLRTLVRLGAALILPKVSFT